MQKLLTALVLVTATSVAMSDANAAELKVGDMVPEFELVGSDGKTYKSSQFKDKSAIVIAWYPKAFTGG